MKSSIRIMMSIIVFMALALSAGGSNAAQESTEPDIIIPSSGKEIILQPISHVFQGESRFGQVDSFHSEALGREA